MEDILGLADRLWTGEATTTEHHPVALNSGLAEVTDGVAFLPNLGNVSAFKTSGGLFMVDTGSSIIAPLIHKEIRHWTPLALNTAVYSHGHIDHVFGVPVFEEEAKSNGWQAPQVIAHEALPHRFDRYILTAGYNQTINRRQFGFKDLVWPTEYRYPDVTYVLDHELQIGDTTVHLHHEKGETDDHTVTWIPSKRVLCCGDLFIWASPNGGNPQKVQRYPREWAKALRRMISLEPDYLLPGHGFPIVGRDRIQQALGDTASYLESLVEQTLALMNEGARLSDILDAVKPPANLAELPYLKPVYDEPEFIVHNIWRLYGGWYDGNPANLKPATDRAIAQEMCDLAGGASRLADRATMLAATGDEAQLRLAGHLIEYAWLAQGDDDAIAQARQIIFTLRAELATSTMAKGVFNWAARESAGEQF